MNDIFSTNKSKRLLFNTQFTWPYSPVEYSLAMALKMRGHNIAMIACGGLPNYCELETSVQSRPECNACLAKLANHFDDFSLPYFVMKDYITSKDLAYATEIADGHSVPQLLAMKINHVQVGQLARLNLFQYYHGYPFEIRGEKEATFRRMVHSGILITVATERILNSFQPDVIITANGKFLQWAPCLSLARQKCISFATWEDLPIIPSGTIISVNGIAHEQNIDHVWPIESSRSLTEAERRQILEHFKLWKAGKTTPFAFYDQNTETDSLAIRKLLELRPEAKVVSLFPNVSWDSTSVGYETAFESMYHWSFDLVAYAKQRPDVEFVIRAHPAETKLPDQYRTTTPICAEIRKRFDPLPANVKLVEGDVPISSYALGAISDVVMVYTSTMGLEFALSGKRPWVAANAYYSGKGFTIDLTSSQHMARLLDDNCFNNMLSSQQIELAKRFAHIVRLRRPFSFPFLDSKTGRFSPPNMDVFSPQGNAIINNLCQYILTGEPFLDIGFEEPNEVYPASPFVDYQTIVIDSDLLKLRSITKGKRFGKWRVNIGGLTIYCHDLLSLYMAGKDIFLHGIYNFNTSNLTPTIIDGGGHIGLFALWAKKRYPNARITVFEPDDESGQLLRQNLAVNKIKDVTIVNAGLYQLNGEVSFGSDHSDGSSIFSKEKTGKIRTVRLSDYIHSEVDFLKLNIEGAELDVLIELGEKLSLVKEMVIEYHGFPETGQRLHTILEVLDRYGFRYSLHDFDAETNPATKPPFKLEKETQFFQLIYAKRLLPAKTQAQVQVLTDIDFSQVEPVSRLFGFDRGMPIDRYYIETFLEQNKTYIHGRVLEIGDNTYTKKYGQNVTHSDILNVTHSAGTTIVGDLTTGENIPSAAFDCIIMPQTIQVIYDVRPALSNALNALKPGGTLLLTASGISQISRYDMDRWGEYWRFTDKSLKKLLAEFTPADSIHVEAFGNVAVAKAFLDGLAAGELPPQVLEYQDKDYQVTLVARVQTPAPAAASTAANRVSPKQNAFATPLVLLYHRVADDPINAQMLAVSPRNFEAHLKELSENYRTLSLRSLLEETRQGIFNPDTVALTFDDGYLDNLTDALPLLEKYQVPTTIFVTAGMVGSDREFWWDALENVFLTGHPLPDELSINHSQGTRTWNLTTPKGRLQAYDELCEFLRNKPVANGQVLVKHLFDWAELPAIGRNSHRVVNREQLLKLSSSPFIEIGAHTVTHTRLSILSPEQQQKEIQNSKRELEAIIKKPVTLFSYPYGTTADFTQETASLVAAAGYEAGIANIQGNVVAPLNLYAVPRWLVRDWPSEEFATWLTEKNKNRLEAKAISNRGLSLSAYKTHPRILLWSQWRSGTHWLADMLSEMTGAAWYYHFDDENNYQDETINQLREITDQILVRHICLSPSELFEHTEALGVKVILLYRDIRDSVASSVNMRKFREGYRKALPPFPDMSISEILKWEVETYSDFYRVVLPQWVKTHNPNLLKIKYEDLVNIPVVALSEIAQFLNLRLSEQKLGQIAEKHSFKNRTNRSSGIENKFEHNRKGIIGDYRNQFSLDEQRMLNDLLGEALVRMGYKV